MGGFTVLNLAYLRDDINTVVALSPLISVYDQMRFLLKSALLAKGVVKYEKKIVPEYASIDLHAFLKQTTKDIMILQSDDDPICSYKYTLQKGIWHCTLHKKWLVLAKISDPKGPPIGGPFQSIQAYMQFLISHRKPAAQHLSKPFSDTQTDCCG